MFGMEPCLCVTKVSDLTFPYQRVRLNDKLKQKKLDLFLDPTVGAIACGVYQFDDNLITRHTSESEMSRWANVEQNQQKAILSQQDPSLVSCANGLVRTRSANRRMARVWRNVETKDN